MTDDGTPAPPGQALNRLSTIARSRVAWLMSQWPGRVALGSASGMARIEIFDRSMTIAAQFFTSVFPILIMTAAWMGKGRLEQVAQALDLPPQTRTVLTEALGVTSSDAFGLVGALVVLVSATSLSRALTRAFAAVWNLPRRPRRLLDWWRWVAVVVVVVLAMMLMRLTVDLVRGLPPRRLWDTVVYLAIYTLIAVYVPWLLMARRVPVRYLAPGGIIFGVMMLIVRPASTVYLSLALQSSAQRYGPIGVAFAYITWLYVISFTLLLSAVIGQVLASDDGNIGHFIRRG